MRSDVTSDICRADGFTVRRLGNLDRMPVVTYRLRNPADLTEVYGADFTDESEAAARAHELADFYRHTIEVCQVIAGRLVVGVESEVEPGPPAPIG